MIFTVAIDGPAAAGKGTVARALAARFGLAHLDTGLLYRAIAAKGGDAVAAARALSEADLAAPGLRTADAGQAASRVAAIPEVRAALAAFQRGFARREGGAVLDGRDIGTVICPDAAVKLFVTASRDARTERRLKELHARGEQISFDDLTAQIAERDRRDTERVDSPLYQAADAHLLDTTDLSIEASVEAACRIIDAALARPGT
jgi:cytidylate kinase